MTEENTNQESKSETETTKTESVEPESKKEVKMPEWLPDRLDRERKSILKQLGVDKVEDAREAIKALKEIQDSRKTELERLQEKVRELESKSKELDSYKSTVDVRAKLEVEKLTPEQREAVLGLVGDNPAEQLRAIDKLKNTWKQEKPEEKRTHAANTSPGANSPPPVSGSSPSKKETWKEMGTNPILAAHYYLQNKVWTEK